MEKKTSKSQMRATKKWKQKNKERNRFLSYRSTAFLFAKSYATKEDIEGLINVFQSENPNAKEEEVEK